MKQFNGYLVLIVFLFATACQPKPESNTVAVDSPKIDLPTPLAKAIEAHGGMDQWQKMNSMAYTLMKGDVKEKHQINLQSRKARIMTDDWTLGFDGEEVWVTPDKAAFGKGSPRFYHNLIFYFFALPYVATDPGINYEVLPDKMIHDKAYDAVKISYNAGVGDAPDDYYIMHFDKETHIMHLLLYTVTYYSKEKSDKYNAIIYDDWIDVNGLKLPGSFKGYKYADGALGDQRYERVFLDHYLSEKSYIDETFAMPKGAEIDPLK